MDGQTTNMDMDQKDILYSVYDLTTFPNCFDYVKFLILSEHKRRALALEAIHVLIPPDRHDTEWLNSFGDAENDWRIRNIILPLNALMPTVRGVTQCSSRDQLDEFLNAPGIRIFPDNYSSAVPPPWLDYDIITEISIKGETLPGLAAPVQAKAMVNQWIESYCPGKKTISVTLRDTDYETERNSNMENWLQFADSLPASEYAVIFLRDSGRIFSPPPEPLSGRLMFDPGSLNIELRAALYDHCDLNMFVGNGCGEIAVFLPNCHYVHFLNVPFVNSPTGFIEDRIFNGWAARDQLMFANPGQYFVFGTDSTENIRKYFEIAEGAERPGSFMDFPPTTVMHDEILLLLHASNRAETAKRICDHFGIEDLPAWLDQQFGDQQLPPLSDDSAGQIIIRLSNDMLQLEKPDRAVLWGKRAIAHFEHAVDAENALRDARTSLVNTRLSLASKAIHDQKFELAEQHLRDTWNDGFRHKTVAETYLSVLQVNGKYEEADAIRNDTAF